MELKMDRDLPEGMALAVSAAGAVTPFTIPLERPPSDTVEMILSIEDYGRLVWSSVRRL